MIKIRLIRLIRRQNQFAGLFKVASVINGLFVVIHVKKREDNKYNKNNDFIPLGINNLYSLYSLFSFYCGCGCPQRYQINQLLLKRELYCFFVLSLQA